MQEHKFDADMLKSVRGTPWELNPKAESREQQQVLPEPIVLETANLEVPAEPAEALKPAEVSGKRKLYTRRSALEKHGYTAGCDACDAHKLGKSFAGKEYTTGCRSRLEGAMANDPATSSRVQEIGTRQTDYLARELERSELERMQRATLEARHCGTVSEDRATEPWARHGRTVVEDRTTEPAEKEGSAATAQDGPHIHPRPLLK